MLSYRRAPSDAVCWNCDRRADELIAITLRTPSGAARTFALCGDCDNAIYAVLVRVPADAGVEIVRERRGLRVAS